MSAASNDIEQRLIDWLEPTLSGQATVSTRPPSTTSADLPHIRVRRAGGAAASRVLDDARVAVDCYARGEAAAYQGLEEIRGWFLEIAPSVRRTQAIRSITEIGGPSGNPDPDLPMLDRYSMTVEIRYRRHLVKDMS